MKRTIEAGYRRIGSLARSTDDRGPTRPVVPEPLWGWLRGWVWGVASSLIGWWIIGVVMRLSRRACGYSATMSRPSPPFRIGHGYDLHRLESFPPAGNGRPFILGGIAIDHDRGPVGHSDGDALLHAVTDSILGGLGLPDIGELFSDRDPQWDGANSSLFLTEAVRRCRDAGWEIGNLDVTVICERPKLAPHKAAMIARLTELLGTSRDRINVKGKTHERVDAVGEGRAIEVHAVALLFRR